MENRTNRLRKWIRRIGIGAGLAAVLAVAVAIDVNAWISALSVDSVYERVEDVPPRTVAIVPGALVWSDGTPSIPLRDRLAAAADLYFAGKVRRILVSGDHESPTNDEPNAMWRWLVRRGVPSRVIFLDHAGFRTLDTMERAARVFRVRDAVICSQRYHLDRSIYLARQAGIDAVGLVSDRSAGSSRRLDSVREFFATPLAVFETVVLDRGPRYLGPPIPIEGDGEATHDRWTR